MNEEKDNKKEKLNNTNNGTKQPDDLSSLNIADSIKIVDVETKKVLLHKRG